MNPGYVSFWIGAAWILYVYAGYPVLLGLFSLFSRVRPKASDGYHPSVSILIAAYNEEKDIYWKINEIFAWDYPADKIEVLVASDASEDRTDDILASIRDPRMRWIRMGPRGGKVRALNQLVTMAHSEILFFTDANAHIESGCLRRMVRHFADPRVGCVTGDSYTIEDDSLIASGAGSYWGYETIIKRLESRLRAVLVCDGAIFCLRRELYTACHPELANDLELPLMAAHRGYWVLHEPDAKVFERDTPSVLEEFHRRRRICSQGMLGMWLLRHTLSGLRLWEFVSHKLLRWLTLVPMLAILSASAVLAAHPFYRAILWAQFAFYGLAAIALLQTLTGKKPSRAFSVPFYVVLGTAGALTGVIEALFGRKFDIWNIPSLSRGAQEKTI